MIRRSALLATVAFRAFDNGVQNSTVGRDIILQAAQSFDGTVDGDEMLKRSPDSAAMLDYWDQTDAIVDGIKAMRAAGEKFFPKFKDEDDDEYKERLECTKMTNVYRDVVETLSSKPFEQEVSLAGETPPADYVSFIEDVDGAGNNLTQFASLTFFNAINSAIDWIMVDMPKKDPRVITRADEKAAGIRPYWSHVLGRNVLWAQSVVINGKETLIYLKIFEPGAPDKVRVFTRDPSGAVTWQLFEKQAEKVDGRTKFAQIDTGPIDIGVIPLVPFATGRRDGRTFKYFPAMQDAADLQIELFQEESGLKWNKKLGAYSMLTGNGVTPQKDENNKPKKLATGPRRVLYAPANGNGQHGEWVFIQPDAAVMTFLSSDCEKTESRLRELGRNPLTAQSANLTVVTAATAAGKAKSVVGAWALLLKDALEQSMVVTAMWLNKPADAPTINVYTEFDEFAEGKDLESLDADRDRGDISRETLWAEKRRRGVYSAEFNPIEEAKRLLAEVPSDGQDNNPDGPGVAPKGKPNAA